MEKFSKKSILQLYKMNIEELSYYYNQLRKYEYENGVELKHIVLRKKIHSLLVEIIKLDRIISKEELLVIKDDRIKNDKPKIYACTHIGGNDVQRVYETIKESAYLFLGDPKGLYKDVNGLLLYLNGVICVDTFDKSDRHIAMERAIELLSKGGNLVIFPEGAWNISPNKPVMYLYKGAVEMAKITGADIIPLGIEQYGNLFMSAMGGNMEVPSNADTVEKTDELRDRLATLKWLIFEQMGVYKRSDVANQTVDEFVENIVQKCEYDFTVQDVYDTMYKPKHVANYDDVFAPILKLRK